MSNQQAGNPGDPLRAEVENAKHLPSEGEDMNRAAKQSTRQGVDAKASTPEYKEAASNAPDPASDPHYEQAARSNREFVEDTSMKYNEEETKFAREQGEQK